jgi:Lon protease-like protein
MPDPAATRTEIPLFPLGTVLFPGGPLPLRIFEARYIDLVRKCLRENTGFGVVLLTEGTEAGSGPTATSDVGTYARIVDFSGQPDGLLGIEARGERRFRILARSRARDGLNFAEVEWLTDAMDVPVPEEFSDLGPALDYVMGQVGDPYESLERRLDDAGWIAGRLAEILPLPTAHKQHCLELDDPVERLRFLRPLFEITTEPPTAGDDEDDAEDAADESDDESDEETDDTARRGPRKRE